MWMDSLLSERTSQVSTSSTAGEKSFHCFVLLTSCSVIRQEVKPPSESILYGCKNEDLLKEMVKPESETHIT